MGAPAVETRPARGIGGRLDSNADDARKFGGDGGSGGREGTADARETSLWVWAGCGGAPVGRLLSLLAVRIADCGENVHRRSGAGFDFGRNMVLVAFEFLVWVFHDCR